MSDEPAPEILRDVDLGEEEGDVFARVAPFFPPETAAYLRARPPLKSRWRVTQRIMADGAQGLFFREMEPAALNALTEAFDAHYGDRHLQPGYRGMHTENLKPGQPKVYIDHLGLTLWLAEERGRT